MQVSISVKLAQIPCWAGLGLTTESAGLLCLGPHTLAHSHCLCTVEKAMLCRHLSNHKQGEGTTGQE